MCFLTVRKGRYKETGPWVQPRTQVMTACCLLIFTAPKYYFASLRKPNVRAGVQNEFLKVPTLLSRP